MTTTRQSRNKRLRPYFSAPFYILVRTKGMIRSVIIFAISFLWSLILWSNPIRKMIVRSVTAARKSHRRDPRYPISRRSFRKAMDVCCRQMQICSFDKEVECQSLFAGLITPKEFCEKMDQAIAETAIVE